MSQDRQKSQELLRTLSELDGPSGYEVEVGRFVGEQLSDICVVSYDNLGSVICELKGSAERPRVMLAAHTDEVGFVVRYIDDKGFVRLTPLGGWRDHVLPAQQMKILTTKGSIFGIIGVKPGHIVTEEERTRVIKKDDLYLDVGAKDRQQATTEFDIRLGDPVVPVSACRPMANPDLLMGKAWDDRAGVAIMMETLRALSDRDHANRVYGVGTVQEEVGLRGAQTSAQTVAPDVAIVLEVAVCGDVPGIDDAVSDVKLDGGPTVYVMDGSAIPNLRLRDMAIDLCAEMGLECQMSVLDRGGTDAGRIHLHASGVPSLVLGVPARHIHAHSGIISLNSYRQMVELTTELVSRLDEKTVSQLRPN
jgi:putative aminopeptidase FrvX